MFNYVKQYTKEDDDYILSNYKTVPIDIIANNLGRDPKSVKYRLRTYGIYAKDIPIIKMKAKSRSKKEKVTDRKARKKYSFEIVVSLFKERGYEIVSTKEEYINTNSKVKYVCSKHKDKGIQEIRVFKFNAGQGCYYCGRERMALSKNKKSISEEMIQNDIKVCESKGFQYIKTEKDNADGKYYIYFICPIHKDLGEQRMSRGNMNRNSVEGCQYCIGRNLPQDYIETLLYNNYPEYYVVSNYEGMNSPLTCYCTSHNLLFTNTAKQIIKYGYGCKKCESERKNKSMRLPNNVVREKVEEKIVNIDLIDISKYRNAQSKIGLRCQKCGFEWYSPYSSIIANNIHCPKCVQQSHGEERINKYLYDNKFHYIPQYSFEDCKNIRALKFDFCVFIDNKIFAIEFNGIQHYEPVDFFGGKENYEETVKRDKIKIEYCSFHNIDIIIIPYWDYENIETILDNKLIS